MDSAARSLFKALSWRAVALSITMAVALLVTHDLSIAAAVGIGDTMIKIGAYYAHERLWNRVRFGRAKEPEYYI